MLKPGDMSIPGVQPRLEPADTSASGTSTSGTEPREKFCLDHTTRATSGSGSQLQVAAYLIEYKALHKLLLVHINDGLDDLDLEDVVLHDPEPLQLCSRRLVVAVISQAFSYMVPAGLEYGYVSTGEAFTFLWVLVPRGRARGSVYSSHPSSPSAHAIKATVDDRHDPKTTATSLIG
ncbi:MAG: hypothetical protein M1832_006388 [Thelocarpon impressellum]|nr:MAG: hypothetical protein M1832_006388 [Thelocarpon impressellum]